MTGQPERAPASQRRTPLASMGSIAEINAPHGRAIGIADPVVARLGMTAGYAP